MTKSTKVEVNGISRGVSVLIAGLMLASAGCNAPTATEGPAPPSGQSVVYTIGLTAATPAGLPKCTSVLAGTTAHVRSPSSLWSCIAGTWVPLPCATVLAGALAYASASQTLLACVGGQWTSVPLPAGPAGPAGATGPAGADGVSTLVTSAPFDPDATCPTGGLTLSFGPDTNHDGVLQPGEVAATAPVCTGAPGADAGVVTPAPDAGEPTPDAGEPAEFTLQPSGDVTLPQGGTTTVTITLDGTVYPSESVRLAVSGLPRSVNARSIGDLGSPSVAADSPTKTFTLVAATDAPVGPTTMVVTGTSTLQGTQASTSLTVTVTAGPSSDLAAFRFSELTLRDPHAFSTFSGACFDITNTINTELQKEITTEGAFFDGLLGFNDVLVFTSYDPLAPTTPAQLHTDARCSFPMSTTLCRPGSDPASALTLVNQPTGTCLGALDGTTSGTTPSIVTPAGHCFASTPRAIPLLLFGTPVQLLGAQVAAVYGSGNAYLDSGLLRGFLRQTDASAAMVKLGSSTVQLASILPGGPGACGTDQRDTFNGEVGWWFYFNFRAIRVPFAP
jgi:hypothetical protein